VVDHHSCGILCVACSSTQPISNQKNTGSAVAGRSSTKTRIAITTLAKTADHAWLKKTFGVPTRARTDGSASASSKSA
jgi:hypothetical protein